MLISLQQLLLRYIYTVVLLVFEWICASGLYSSVVYFFGRAAEENLMQWFE
jgi:hypothetical protein